MRPISYSYSPIREAWKRSPRKLRSTQRYLNFLPGIPSWRPGVEMAGWSYRLDLARRSLHAWGMQLSARSCLGIQFWCLCSARYIHSRDYFKGSTEPFPSIWHLQPNLVWCQNLLNSGLFWPILGRGRVGHKASASTRLMCRSATLVCPQHSLCVLSPPQRTSAPLTDRLTAHRPLFAFLSLSNMLSTFLLLSTFLS